MISNRQRLVVASWFLLFLLLAGCGAQRSEQSMVEAPAAMVDNYAASDAMSEPAPPAEAAAVDAALQDGVPLARKIVARATMTIVVEETDAVVEAIGAELAAIGGYVAQANLYRNSYGGDERLQGTMTLRVPAAELERVMADLEEMAVDVRDKTISREDITDQYSDVDARLRNLTATEDELREMLAEVRAKPDATPEDILTVYRHLTEIRGQIEQAQGRKNMFDNLVGLSTLELTLTPNWTTLPVVEEGWQPSRTLRNASRELVSALQDLADFGIWFVVFLLPVLLLLLIPLVVVFLILRALVRRVWRRKRTTPSLEQG
jgi:hypothetical protein